MPFVRIQLKEGRTAEQKQELAQAIVEAMEQQKFAPAENVRVIYEEMAPENFYPGDLFKKEN